MIAERVFDLFKNGAGSLEELHLLFRADRPI